MNVDVKNLTNHELVSTAKNYVAKEKMLDAMILEVVREIKHRKIHLHEGYASLADYCGSALGMSEDQAWKRSQAVDTINEHPWALDMLKNGDTKLSQIALIKHKITPKNEEIIKDFLPGKTKVEVKNFLETVGLNGERLEPSKYVEVKLRIKKDTMDKMKRARELKAKGARMPSLEEMHDEVYAFWLAHHCPLEKAKRAEARKEKKVETAKVEKSIPVKTSCSGATEKTRYIKAEVRHSVSLDRSTGCCYIGPDGKRCGSTYKLQYNHKVPFALGGDSSADNLEMVCAPHNQYLADLAYGRRFMDTKRHGA